MAWIAVAVGAGAAISAGASYAASSSAADAQKQAADKQAQSQKDANQLNYQMYQESRGSNGSAVLPTYLRNPDGSLFEGTLGSDLVGAYNQANKPLSAFQGATASTAPAQAGATKLTNDIFTGGVTKTLLGNAAPVQSARLATARSSSMDALHKTLDAIDAQQASRGITGDSYSNRLLQFQAGKSAGDSIGAANVQNLQENADIKNYGGITLPLQNMTLPYTQAQQAGNLQFLPNDLWLQSLSQRIQPLNFLKLGYTGAYQYQPIPTAPPGAYAGTANALGGISGLASGVSGSALQYYLQKQLQNNYLQQVQFNNALNSSATTTNTALATGVPQLYQAAAQAPAGTWTNGVSSFSPDTNLLSGGSILSF